MPRIASVAVCVAVVPLEKVTSFATRTVRERHYCLVKVRSVEGIEGVGYCYAGDRVGQLLGMAAADLLAPKLIGEDSLRVEGLWDQLYHETILQGRAGPVMRVLSAMDMALWDLNARSAGLPLYQYLGAVAWDSVPAYASGGYYLEGKTPRLLGKELEGFAKRGYTAVKMKVGRLSLAEEERRVRAAREAIGPEVELMLDANNAWRDLPTALRYMDRFERYDPYWIEEPFSPDDIENHSRLAERIQTSVATGEIEAGRWRFKEVLDRQAADILQTDATVCGGVTEWRRIVATAASYGVTVSPHAWHDIHVHLVATAPNARYVEFFPDAQIVNFRRLIDTQIQFHKGRLLLPKTSGLGFNFDERSVKKYAIHLPGATGPWRIVR
jgi:L-alanine-DL-glutamate epimerase-like enolase superfamily enzyme